MTPDEKVKRLLVVMKQRADSAGSRWSRERAEAFAEGLWWGIAALLDLQPFEARR